MTRRPAVLVIAATDSSGGAGLTRDVATLTSLASEARCVVTAVTAQSHTRVARVHPLPADLIRAQLEAAFASGPIDAIKIGMLGTAPAVQAVLAGLPSPCPPVVLDPVLVASSGGVLLDAPGQLALRALLPRVTLLTPNLPEAATLLQEPKDPAEAAAAASEPATQARLLAMAQRLRALGPAAVLLKGGHGSGETATDYLAEASGVHALSSPRLAASRRGTGCSLASGVAAGLAAGLPLLAACERARAHVLQRLADPE